ncbi:hypothetical protein [Sporolactobacillus terrae]|uniref:hypothetical protein n=1 Tax=Sporolactobacillus terrae TaxID=269673 RepID=UPI00048DFA8A|nr:hypothetical protein [Sporolactobacillus terrae]
MKLYKVRATMSVVVDLNVVAENEQELKDKTNSHGKSMANYVASLDDAQNQFRLVGFDNDEPINIPDDLSEYHYKLLEYGYPFEVIKNMDADEAEGELDALFM